MRIPDFAKLVGGLSVAHLLVCYLFLYFLTAGFGGGVSRFVSPSDIVGVSLGDVLPFYLLFIPGLILNQLWMLEKPFQVVERDDFSLHPSVDTKGFRTMMIALAVLTPCAQIIAIASDRPALLIGLFFPLMFFAGWWISNFISSNQLPQKFRLPLILGFVGLLQVATGAYAKGFDYRNHVLSRQIDAPTICDSQSILLFPVGLYFISAKENGERVAYSHDCNEVLKFPKKRIVIDILPI